jgi:hypothetical protein
MERLREEDLAAEKKKNEENEKKKKERERKRREEFDADHRGAGRAQGGVV